MVDAVLAVLAGAVIFLIDQLVAERKQNMMRLNFGDKAKDKITQFEGVITGFSRFITGCDQYCLTPQGLDKDGKPQESKWFDENRLDVTGTKAVVIPGVSAGEGQAREQTGGRFGAPSDSSEQPRNY